MTNAAIMLAPPSMLNPDFKPSLPLPHFNKHLLGAEHGDEAQAGGLRLQLGRHLQVGPTGPVHAAHSATVPEHSIPQSLLVLVPVIFQQPLDPCYPGHWHPLLLHSGVSSYS